MSSDDNHTDTRTRQAPAALASQVAANDIKWLMANKQGRRIVCRLLAEAGIHRTSFTGNSETFFREGKRAFGLFIESEVCTHAFADYVLMLTESKEKA